MRNLSTLFIYIINNYNKENILISPLGIDKINLNIDAYFPNQYFTSNFFTGKILITFLYLL